MGYLYTLYAEAADAAGEALAVDGGRGAWTYAELLERVREFTGRLKRAGAGAGLRIGVADDLGADLYPAVLAVSALDCSLVPYVADGPQGERKRLERLGIWGTVSAGASAVDITAHGAAARDLHRHAQSEAYVLSTSGSTSAPKDVAIGDRNLESYAGHLRTVARSGPGDRISQNYQPQFDAFYEVLMMAALGRSALVVPDGREHLLVQRFCERWGVTVWNSVPSQVTMAHRLRQLNPGSLPGIKLAVFGGEALSEHSLALWRAAAPASTVINSYGPSETTVACTEYVLGPETEHAGSDVPIGRVLPHLEGRLVEPAVAPGELELCVRGPQIFDGYLDPRHNAGRFYTETDGRLTPLQHGSPTRGDWYRTGDIVVETERGLVFRRRADHETKVRGKRVDLTAVEDELRRQPGVTEARVLVLDDAVHAVVETLARGDDAPDLDLTGLRDYARPRTVVRVASLPRLPNGKTDLRAVEQLVRQALRAPAAPLTTTTGGQE
ncbi:AMP-binding protein [Streptomyces sp. NPDC048442]|uniref:AMP-binding protein n=1 Tax=Streptomyces sp. NPDC048442 TaxID=3154823 RepID=UPI003429A474